MANNYIAVTIGPVLDTINLASSPSALWAASYMMSMLSKNICLSLIKRKVPQEDIVSPYFDEKNVLFNRKDGVGLFHDRVIFKADNFNIKDFPAVRDEAIKNTVAYFGFTKDKDIKYFKEYFLVSAVLLENSTNPIMDSGKNWIVWNLPRVLSAVRTATRYCPFTIPKILQHHQAEMMR